MQKRKSLFTSAILLIASLPALAQQGHDENRDQSREGNRAAQSDSGNHESANYGNQRARANQNFYNGVREGGRGGQYYDPRHANDGYDQRFSERRGAVGPGQGAAIGGIGGAILGAVLGGGLRGSLIGGAAGAGIGAVVGESAQNGRRYSNERR
jgi:hypothetical protein